MGRKFFWLFIFSLFILFFYVAKDVVLLFLSSFVLSYFLNPLVNWFERLIRSRTLSTAIIILFFVAATSFLIVKISPIIYEQVQHLISQIPSYKKILTEKFTKIIAQFSNIVNDEQKKHLLTSLENFISFSLHNVSGFLNQIWNSGLSFLYSLSLFVLTPVVSFYLMRDWNKLMKQIEGLIPLKSRKIVKHQFSLIDQALSGFIRGQMNVCLLLSLFYSVALYSIGLQFALVIGIASGLLVFVPYLGFLVGVISGTIVAFVQFNDLYHVMLVLGVFVSGQFIEGNFITPKLVGEKIGLHPVWIIFLVLLGGNLFGFIGVLLAVPVGAICAVLIRMLLKYYRDSSYYQK